MKSVESKYIKEVSFDDADAFLKAINYGGELYEALSGRFVFRGHYSSKYSLLPYALRPGALDDYYQLKDFADNKAIYVQNLEYTQILQEYNLLQSFYSQCDCNNLRVPECERLRHNIVHVYPSLLGEAYTLCRGFK